MKTNTNNHTTSTKCQYQAANSKPKNELVKKWYWSKRKKHTNKNKVPTNTWKPWNPVIIKNKEPKTLSRILKGEDIYSRYWHNIKIKPNNTVKAKPITEERRQPNTKARWAHVTVAPEDNKIIVFIKGKPQALMLVMWIGGQTLPSNGWQQY